MEKMEKMMKAFFMALDKIKPKVVVFLIIYLAIGGVIVFTISESRWQRMLDTYWLVDTESEFEGVVFDIKLQKFTCVNLNNKIFLRFGSMNNCSYRPYNFSSFLQRGDSIYKKEESDTIFIIRNDTRYYFIINRLSCD